MLGTLCWYLPLAFCLYDNLSSAARIWTLAATNYRYYFKYPSSSTSSSLVCIWSVVALRLYQCSSSPAWFPLLTHSHQTSISQRPVQRRSPFSLRDGWRLQNRWGFWKVPKETIYRSVTCFQRQRQNNKITTECIYAYIYVYIQIRQLNI